MKQVFINTEFITLGQFLKFVGIIESGSFAKYFLSEYEVLVNDKLEDRRGRKLYPSDKIYVDGETFIIVQEQ